MRSSRSTRVVMIGLDAASPHLVEAWTEDGSLPNLRELMGRGAYSRLAGTADWLTGSPWPTFYTGMHPSEHGFYDSSIWRRDLMAQVAATSDWLPLTPFWRDLSSSGPRVISIDVPMGYSAQPFNGIEVAGWATHDRLDPPSSYPRDLLPWIRRNFGSTPMKGTVADSQEPHHLREVRDRLVQSTRSGTELARTLMQRESWDLFIWVLGETHRGGHQLWGFPGAEQSAGSRDAAGCLQLLKDVYVSADEALGRIIETAGTDTTFLVFSLHGMGSNHSRSELVLPKMLHRVLLDSRGPRRGSEKTSSLDRIRRKIPVRWRHDASRLMPQAWRERLNAFWRMGRMDWTTTRAFNLYSDQTGQIRISLRGREKRGIVEPGTEYDELCEKIVEGLQTFTDADTGAPLVEQIQRADQVFPDGPRRKDLPDLMIKWDESPAAAHRQITSPRYGEIPWPTPGAHPDHRSGNHRGEGFLIISGGRIRSEVPLEDRHILDLAPTLYALFGTTMPEHFAGRPLPTMAVP